MPKMRLRYDGPSAAVEIAETGDVVRRGTTVVVEEELGDRLLEQGCEIALVDSEDDDGNPTTERIVTRLDGAPWSKAGGPVPDEGTNE